MDTIDPHWRKRLRQERRHIDDPGSETLFVNWETFLEKIFPEPKKKRKNRPKTKIQLRADAICEETWQVASTAEVLLGYYDSVSGQFRPVPQLSLAIKRPPEEYGWTRALPGYEIAFSSAVSAAHGLWAATHAAAAGYDSKNPQLDVFLFQIRAG